MYLILMYFNNIFGEIKLMLKDLREIIRGYQFKNVTSGKTMHQCVLCKDNYQISGITIIY